MLYAVLDISVLQAYCGNETLGIPPYAAELKLERKSSGAAALAEVYVVASQTSGDEESNDTPISEDACFCCCSHTTVTVNLLVPYAKRPVSSLVSAPNFSPKNLHPDSHPSRHYQPPKFS